MLPVISNLNQSLLQQPPYILTLADKSKSSHLVIVSGSGIDEIVVELMDIGQLIQRVIISLQTFSSPNGRFTRFTHKCKLIIGCKFLIDNNLSPKLNISYFM